MRDGSGALLQPDRYPILRPTVKEEVAAATAWTGRWGDMTHQIVGQRASLGAYEDLIQHTVRDLAAHRVAERLWARDPSLWKEVPEHQREIEQRLGWLTVAGDMRGQVSDLEAFAREAGLAGIEHVVLCGMGGSSLGAEVLRRTFGSSVGYPRLWVLDSTDPATVDTVARQAEPAQSLYLISSKSGGTTEVDSLFRHFFERARAELGERAGAQFVAITDPGTSLEQLAAERGFRRTFLNPPDIGGRYSVLSLFGLVPAALIGLDLARLLEPAERMARACAADKAAEANPGLWLGAALGGFALAGRDKLTLLASPRLASFGLWVEQLIAESTGKEGKGIVPVADEPLAAARAYGDDRVFVYLRLATDDNIELDRLVAELEVAGQPLVALDLEDEYDLGGEFFRWEFATAVAGAVLRIDPFDQPNVQESKDNTGRLLTAYRETGSLPAEAPDLIDGELSLRGTTAPSVREALAALLDQARPGDYVALLAYLERAEPTDRALAALRERLRDRTGLAATLGYGPRFLHSTGQLHKGGPDTGVFIQLTADGRESVPIPGQPYDFGALKAAQALGDWQALRGRDRRALWIHLGGDVSGGLQRLQEALM